MSTGSCAQDPFQSALAAQRDGRLEDADRLYRQVLATSPRNSPASNNLGITLAMRGRVAEAVPYFRQALDADPRSVDACVNLAQACQQLGRADEALASWRRAMTMSPQVMEPALAAGLLCLEAGRLDEAGELLATAARRTPRLPETRGVLLDRLAALASARIDAGALSEAHRLAALLLELAPDDAQAARMVAHCLRRAEPQCFDRGIKHDLLRCFASDHVDHRELARAAARLLLLEHPALATGGAPHQTLEAVCAAGVHRDPLLLALLWRSVNADPQMESTITALRHALLLRVAGGGDLGAAERALLGAIAAQCFANEYVLAESPEERSAVDTLCRGLRDGDSGGEPIPSRFAAVCAYRAPWRLAGAAQLAHALGRTQDPPWLTDLVRRSLVEPLGEEALRVELAGAPVTDPVSRRVMRQYEESPYPRWLTLERPVPGSMAEYLREVLPGWTPPALFDAPVRILVAGCGTGEHALRVAVRHPGCQVEAVDLSVASLAYGLRKQRELGIENVRFRQADILSLGADDGPYQVIESVGVLHHLDQPAAGLAALTTLLDAQGVIKLGLYSRLARRHVARARERIRALGLEAVPRDMRALRQRILAGQEPELASLARSVDFYALSTVRDLLFHVQEHTFDIPGLSDLLSQAGLAVLGFQVPPAIRRRYLERFPDDARLCALDNWQAFEAAHPDTFAGMYQLYCRRR